MTHNSVFGMLDCHKDRPTDDSLSPFMTNMMPGNFEKKLEELCCPFCRSTDDMGVCKDKSIRAKRKKILERRARNGDKRALLELGKLYLYGNTKTPEEMKAEWGIGQDAAAADNYDNGRDIAKALECFKEAASLGNSDAHYALSDLHLKNYEAADYLTHLEKAAELGSMEAHQDLAELAMQRQKFKLAMEHYKILAAAGLGFTKKLMDGYKEGHVTKDDLETSLRASHAARKELASTDRADVRFSGQVCQPMGRLFRQTNFCRCWFYVGGLAFL